MVTTRNIGIDVKPPKGVCEDEHCPYHGRLSIRGNIIKGKVVSAKATKTAIISRAYLHFVPKYERYERRHSKITAYNPTCIDAKEGDIVTLAECRPISKTKHFTVIEKVGG